MANIREQVRTYFHPETGHKVHVDFVSDDWLDVYLDDHPYRSGHDLSQRDWLELLAACDVTVTCQQCDTDDIGEIVARWPVEQIE